MEVDEEEQWMKEEKKELSELLIFVMNKRAQNGPSISSYSGRVGWTSRGGGWGGGGGGVLTGYLDDTRGESRALFLYL